jgi:dihydroorotase
MIESYLIKNVDIVTPSETKRGDILIEHGKISKIGPSLNSNSAEVIISESGLTALAGGIDPHVHFRDPGATHKEDLYTGSKAAAAGGITSFFEMPNTSPSTTSVDSMTSKKKIAREKCLVNYNFFIGATKDNFNECISVENVPGIKIYVGSSTGSLLVDNEDTLSHYFANTNRLIAVHSEDETILKRNYSQANQSLNPRDHYKIRSVEAALTCTERLVRLAIKYKTRLHICHLTSKEELEFLIPVMKKHANITTEVTPQHLFTFGPDLYDEWGTYAQINPPIRTQDHAIALQKGLLDNHIHLVCTDHAPHTKEEKDKPFGQAPSGMPGVETSLPLLLDKVNQGWCTLQDVTKWMSKNVSTCFNIENKGLLEEGYDADLILVDMNAKKTINGSQLQTKCKWSCFEGLTLQGWPLFTFVNGQLVFRESDFFEKNRFSKEIIIKS